MAVFNFRFSVQSVREGAILNFSSKLKGLDGQRLFSQVSFSSDTSDPFVFMEKFAAFFYESFPFSRVYLYGNGIVIAVDDFMSVDNVCGGDEIPVSIDAQGIVVYAMNDWYWTCETENCNTCCPEFECFGCGELFVRLDTPYVYVESEYLLGCNDCFPYDAGKILCPLIPSMIDRIKRTYLLTGGLDFDVNQFSALQGWICKKNEFISYRVDEKNKVLVIEFQRTELGGGSNVSFLAYVEPAYAYAQERAESHLTFKAWYVKNNYVQPALYPTVQYISSGPVVSPPPNAVEFDWNYCYAENECFTSFYKELVIKGEVSKNYCCKNSEIYALVRDVTQKTEIKDGTFEFVVVEDVCNSNRSFFILEFEACGKKYEYYVPVVKPSFMSQLEIERFLLAKGSEYYESARDCDSCCPEVALLEPCLEPEDAIVENYESAPFEILMDGWICEDNLIKVKFVNKRILEEEEYYKITIFELQEGDEIYIGEITSFEISQEIDFYLKAKTPYKWYVYYYKGENLLKGYQKSVYYLENVFPVLCEDATITHETCKNYNDGKVKFPFKENIRYELYSVGIDESLTLIGHGNEYENLPPGRYKMRLSLEEYCQKECNFEIRPAYSPVVSVVDVQPQCEGGAKKVEIKVTGADLSCKECYEGVTISIDDQEYVQLDSTNVYVTVLNLGYHFVKVKDCGCCLHIHKFNVKEKIITN